MLGSVSNLSKPYTTAFLARVPSEKRGLIEILTNNLTPIATCVGYKADQLSKAPKRQINSDGFASNLEFFISWTGHLNKAKKTVCPLFTHGW